MFTQFWNKYGEKIISVSKGAVLAGIGAIATYYMQQIGSADFGEYTAFVAAGIAVAANILRKFGVPVAVGIAKSVRVL